MVPDERNKKVISAMRTVPASKKRHLSSKSPKCSCSKKQKRDKKCLNVATRKVSRSKKADSLAAPELPHSSISLGIWEGSKTEPSEDLMKVPRTNGMKKNPNKILTEYFEDGQIEDPPGKPDLSVKFSLESDQSPELNAVFTRNKSSFTELARVQEHLMKRDKVWNYVCKRSVLVAPMAVQLSSKIAEGLKFPHEAIGNETRTVRTSIPVFGRMISVTLTCEATVAEEWLKQQAGELFGLDVEWKPNRGKGVDNKVALLQLSGNKACLLLQMLFMDFIPQSLVDFLLDSKRKKAGVGIIEDAKKLFRDYGLACNGIVELTSLATQQLGRSECKHMGLKALAKEVIGITMQKLKRVTMSNWANPILDRSQVMYACVDAWASFAVCCKLQVADA